MSHYKCFSLCLLGCRTGRCRASEASVRVIHACALEPVRRFVMNVEKKKAEIATLA